MLQNTKIHSTRDDVHAPRARSGAPSPRKPIRLSSRAVCSRSRPNDLRMSFSDELGGRSTASGGWRRWCRVDKLGVLVCDKSERDRLALHLIDRPADAAHAEHPC